MKAVRNSTVGTVYSELVPASMEQTPVEMGSAAASALAASPAVKAWKPRLKPHLSRSNSH
ncbi:MAG: hypothetical protein ABSA46_08085 [Thermodesulfovibrionales bacterium]|jgi:hypothetical protein